MKNCCVPLSHLMAMNIAWVPMKAPPAIISVFSGSYLKEVLEMIEKRVDEDKFDEQDNITLRLDIHNRIPDIMLDNTGQKQNFTICIYRK
jgi:glutamine synthetase type III